MQAQFSSTDPREHGAKWDDLWKQDFVPWDKGLPNPALVDLLVEGKVPVVKLKTGGVRPKALVPGCGRGYGMLDLYF